MRFRTVKKGETKVKVKAVFLEHLLMGCFLFQTKPGISETVPILETALLLCSAFYLDHRLIHRLI